MSVNGHGGSSGLSETTADNSATSIQNNEAQREELHIYFRRQMNAQFQGMLTRRQELERIGRENEARQARGDAPIDVNAILRRRRVSFQDSADGASGLAETTQGDSGTSVAAADVNARAPTGRGPITIGTRTYSQEEIFEFLDPRTLEALEAEVGPALSAARNRPSRVRRVLDQLRERRLLQERTRQFAQGAPPAGVDATIEFGHLRRTVRPDSPASVADAATREERTRRIRQFRAENETPAPAMSRSCRICFTDDPLRRAVFSACGHAVCRACAEELADIALNERKKLICPFCRKETGFVPLFEDPIADY